METKHFSIQKALSFGWQAFVNNLYQLLYLGIIFVAVQVVTLSSLYLFSFAHVRPMYKIITNAFMFDAQCWYSAWGCDSLFNILGLLALWLGLTIFRYALALGFVRWCLEVHDKGSCHYTIIFSTTPSEVIGFALLGLCFNAIIGIGTLLLIIPGIVWGLTYSLVFQRYVDKRTGIMDAFRESRVLTRGTRLKLLGYYLVIGLINMAGYVSIIGLFVTIPVTKLATAYVYRTLEAQTKIREQ